MNKTLLLLLSVFFCFRLTSFAVVNDVYYFSNLNLKDGLSQISVLNILQDSKGYMWFATRNGLNKYDGNKFTVYKHSNVDSLSLSDNHVTILKEDEEGFLWIGTGRGLNRLDLRTNKIERYTKKHCKFFEHGIRSLLVDSKKRLWIGTSKGLCLYVREANMFQIVDLNGKIKDEFISSLYETSDHQLLIGTASKGLYVCDLDLKILNHFSKETSGKALPGNNVATIYEDSRKQLWVGCSLSGLVNLNIEKNKVISYTKENSDLSNNNIRCLAEHQGTLFVGTFDGLYTIDLDNNSIVRHSNADIERGNLTHFSIYSLFVDKSGIVWVGTYSGGVNYFSKYNNRFAFHEPTNVFSVLFGIFGSMICRPPSCLYMATEGGGLLDYNLNNGRYQFYLIEHKSQSQHSQNIIKSVMLENDNTIWCGTNKGRIYQFDTRSKKYSLYHDFSRDMSVYSILRSKAGDLWVGTSNPETGLFRISADKKVQNGFEIANDSNLLYISSVRCILELRKGIFLIGTRNGGLLKYDETIKTVVRYNVDLEGGNKLLSNYITSILRDSSGRIWIGTFGGGLNLYDEKKGIIKKITIENGLINDDICSVVEDDSGCLWISTSNGISKFDVETEEFSNYDQFSGIGVQEFTPHSGTKLPNGNICFSGSNGFVTFNPIELQSNSFLPPIVLTGLAINNKVIEPGENNLLKSVIDDTDRIELKYDQNNLSVEYCALNYIYPDQNQYAYRLVGHDKDWNYVENRNEAFYTNLSPGTYTFEVKASNNDGIWSDKIRSLEVIINPPFWKTWYAYLTYAILFIGISSLILYYTMTKQRLEQELKFKQMEKLQLEEFHQTKIRLFTNFSHELRTPLTLILSPLQELLQVSDFNSSVKNKLSLIFSNSQRLLLLVNQLMDLRKNQTGKMLLKISEDEICAFIQEIYYAFNQIAQDKHIEFHFEKEQEYINAWFDKTLFEKVVFNLLSNAFKFTKNGGTVTLSLKRVRFEDLNKEQQEDLKETMSDSEYICLSVSDTGDGVPASEVKNIFAPFYQIEKQDNENTVGTGIGLSLTQSIVHLHNGTIWVDSNQPVGSVFRVVIPINKSMYKKEQLIEGNHNQEIPGIITSSMTQPVTFEIEKKYTILLVEDNNDVRTYVKQSLEPYYFVLEADNGLDAFDLVVDKYPDLVVSDIMMPKMDGLQLCTLIKKDLRVGHIPVVLMTAKSMVVHIKEGFSVGADDYIIKPFNIDVLIYRIKNLLESREKLKRLYGKKFSPDSLGIEIVSSDDRFTQKFFGVIEENISNPELSIDLLAREVGLSRANLYRKLKAITELSPTELIRNKRLEIAAKLLSESDLSISEISVHVGFNSHAYFTNSFKYVYGYSPSEFIQKHRDGDGETADNDS